MKSIKKSAVYSHCFKRDQTADLFHVKSIYFETAVISSTTLDSTFEEETLKPTFIK